MKTAKEYKDVSQAESPSRRRQSPSPSKTAAPLKELPLKRSAADGSSGGNGSKIISRLRSYQVQTKHGLFIIISASAISSLVIIYLSVAAMPLATTPVVSVLSLSKNYISDSYNYQVRYPGTWSYEVNASPLEGVLEEVAFIKDANKIVVITANEVSTATLFPEAPLELDLNGTAALRYHDYDSATGQPLDRVIIKREDGRYNELRGYGTFFERLIGSFIISSP